MYIYLHIYICKAYTCKNKTANYLGKNLDNIHVFNVSFYILKI